MSEQQPIDTQGVIERTGIDVEMLVSLIEDTVPYLVGQIESLCQAAGAGDGGKVAVDAHAIKGSAATLGMEDLRTLALKIEQIGKGIAEGDMAAESQSLHPELRRASEYAVSLGGSPEKLDLG